MPTKLEAVGARSAVAVTKSDTTIYDNSAGGPFQALWIGGAGNVAVRDLTGVVNTFAGCAAGGVVPIQCDKVMSTNTTATSILGLRY